MVVTELILESGNCVVTERINGRPVCFGSPGFPQYLKNLNKRGARLSAVLAVRRLL